MSGILPTLITPDDVRTSKLRLDAFARSLDRSVSVCPRLHPYTRASWAEFYRGWRQFADADASWFHASAEYDTAQRYEEHLVAWQAQLAPFCSIAGAPLTRPQAAGGTAGSSLETTIKTAAVAGAVVAVALAIREAMK